MCGKTECILMKLDGVRGSGDRKALGAALHAADGVRSVSVRGDTARVAFYPERTTVAAIVDVVRRAGYEVV